MGDKQIKYTSSNGYTGILYGESSLAILDKDGNEKLHTGSRNINTLQELIQMVDTFPAFLKMLNGIAEDINNGTFDNEDYDI